MSPYPYDTGVFWPLQTTILNRDLIEYSGTDNLTINGKDFDYVDAYALAGDHQEDGHETTLDFYSRPPKSDIDPFGVFDFTVVLRSPYFPRLAMYECTLIMVSDRRIFDPKRLGTIDVTFEQSQSIKVVGEALNIYKCDLQRIDNWFMIKFCQILEILDPKVSVKVRVRMNRLGSKSESIPYLTKLDVTPILSWYSSITKFLKIDQVDEGSSLSAQSETYEKRPIEPPPIESSS
uniref:Uncharacterized protein n=1 Tax=Marma virus TaxID=2651926 RepID=A0A894KMG3_9LUTE|nr:MAG: hypothetical protein [Marma virus]